MLWMDMAIENNEMIMLTKSMIIAMTLMFLWIDLICSCLILFDLGGSSFVGRFEVNVCKILSKMGSGRCKKSIKNRPQIIPKITQMVPRSVPKTVFGKGGFHNPPEWAPAIWDLSGSTKQMYLRKARGCNR